MGLKEVFQKAAVTAVTATGNVPKESLLIVTIDDGWGDSNGAPTEHSINLIYSSFKKRGEIPGTVNAGYSFSDLIMVGDVKGLLPALEVPSGVNMKEMIHQQIKRIEDDQTFSIEGFDLDAADALYVLLLRKA